MTAHDHRAYVPGCFRCELSADEVLADAESVKSLPNGDLHVTDVLGREARLYWSRFHGLIILMDEPGAIYLGQDAVTAWLLERLNP